jgi:RNA polymerase sigma-70 factor (ECF subfamily)
MTAHPLAIADASLSRLLAERGAEGIIAVDAVAREQDARVDDLSDEALVEAIGSGTIAALGVLVRRYQDRIRGLAFRMLRNRDEADSVAQDVFLKIHRAAARFEPRARASTWIYRIAVNACNDQLRRRKNRPARLEDVAPPAAEPSPDPLEACETARKVREAVDALPQRQRTALLLHRYDGLSHEEIAEATGWSRSAVESLIVRAYSQLRRELAPLL